MNTGDMRRSGAGAVGETPRTAANDDHGPAPSLVRDVLNLDAVGWDPFEVWRTRVRDPRLLRAAVALR